VQNAVNQSLADVDVTTGGGHDSDPFLLQHGDSENISDDCHAGLMDDLPIIEDVLQSNSSVR
jgi:hypothetical protein